MPQPLFRIRSSTQLSSVDHTEPTGGRPAMKTVSQKGAIRSTNGHSALHDTVFMAGRPGVSPRVKTLAARRNGRQDTKYGLGLTIINVLMFNPTRLSHSTTPQGKKRDATLKCSVPKEANQCSRGAPSRSKTNGSKLSDDFDNETLRPPKVSKLLGLKPTPL